MRKLLSFFFSTLQGGVRGGLLLLLLVASVSAIYASDTQVDGIWYDFDSSTKTASVTYRGNSYYDYDDEYSGIVIIPETVTYNGTTYSVTSIGDDAFCDCSSLTSVTIPNSVTSIGNWAFYECSSLTSVTIPNSVISIGRNAFEDCSSLTKTNYTGDIAGWCNIKFGSSSANPMYCSHNFYINDQEIKDLVIPNSVTSIGSYAFNGCSSLSSVTIGESVTSIGYAAFRNCSSLPVENNLRYADTYLVEAVNKTLSTYSIKEGTKWVGDDAFYGCSSLTSVTIPNSVRSIGYEAFGYCSKLTSVTIGESVTSIGEEAFAYCSSLTSVTIPNSVTSIGDDAFRGCSKLTSVTIGESVTSIGEFAFAYCSSLTSVTIGESVKSIGDDAFYGCSSLTSVTINSDAIVSKDYSYGDNISPIFGSKVTEYIIGESVTSIGSYAFYDCSSLTSVTIGESVKSIGEDAFYGCSKLTSITIPNSVTSIGSYAFYYCSSLTSVTIGESVTSIGEFAFYECTSLTSVTIGESVKSIGEEAFYNCFKLTKTNYTGDIVGWCNIEFDGSVANPICYSQNFYINDQEIKDLVISNSVKRIEDYAFVGCSSLTSVTIPNSVKSIGYEAFGYCSKLTSVTIGESVKSIGEEAFAGCSKLTSVTINSDAIVSKNYSSSSNISDIFGSQVTEYIIGESVTSIGDYPFLGCSSLTSVTIGESVKSIGDYAFRYCSSLTSVTCEAETPPTVGQYAFDGVSKSIPIYIPCGCIDAYKAASGWEDFTNIQVPLAEYSIIVDVNDTIMGTANVDYNTFCEGAQISATPNIGYHFVQWNDGNTENPRTLELTQDTTFSAEFAQSFSGQCGDNLYWSYNETAKTISITGSGEMYDYTASTQPWLLFKEQIVEVTTTNTVTSIGTSAFEGCIRLSKISLGTGLKDIAANAFAGCTRLYDIYVYATYPPFAEESSFANYNVYVYIPCEYQRDYILDVVWGEFKFIECIDSEEATTDGNVTIVPGFNDVTITWPTETGADSYTIVIKKGDTVFCTLTFSADGQLLNIAFAPSRDGNHPAQYAEQAVNGYRFTVTGLEEGTQYAYNITTKDAANKTIATYSGEFTTMGGTTTDMDNIQSPMTNCQKILYEDHIYILRDGKTYTIMGAEVK